MAEDDLTMRLQRSQRLLAASRDGYWERDLRSGEVWYSDSFYALLGLSPDAPGLASDQVRTRLHPDDQDAFRAAFRTAVACCGSFDYEMRFLDGAGHWRWLRGRGRAWAGPDGQAEVISGACTDVQHEHQAVATLEAQTRQLEAQVHERTEGLAAALRLADLRRVQAEQANASKSRYLTHISHEIRTPLAAMLALTELARRGAHSTDQRRYLEQANASGAVLRQMVDEVLDLERIEAGSVELRCTDFDPAESLAATLRALMPLADVRRLVLLFDHLGREGRVHGDEGALRQVVTNLVGNAIKHAPLGSVRVTLQVATGDGEAVRLTLTVADDGPGIAEHRQATIFEPFVQGDGDTATPAPTGAGMGLAIARGLARSMGGDVTLHCPAEGGSVFTATLAMSAASGPAAADAAEPPRRAGRAWLVQNVPAAGAWLCRRLERLGWECVVHDRLVDAVAVAQRADDQRPDLVVVASGTLHAGSDLRPLRQALPAATLRLLIRPDWHGPMLEAQARALGIETLVTPLTPAALRGLGVPLDSAAPAPAAEADAFSVEALPAAEAEVLLVEDDEVNQLAGRGVLEALGLRVRLARDGRQALAACAERAPDLVLMDLHLPDMDGRRVTEQLHTMQAAGQWPGAPIVALTASATQDDRALCDAAGMSGVLLKPLSVETLRRELGRWL